MSNSKMILCGKPSLLDVFERGKTAGRIPDDGANIVYGEMMLRDLIPLSWKVPPVIQNGNDPRVSMTAAELLGVQNSLDLLCDYVRLSKNYSQVIPALPGDFVVVMPLAGLGAEVGYEDNADSAAWFGKNKVKVAYVGKELPADVAHVYRHVQWNRLHIEQPDPIADAIKAQGNLKVTIFDALRLNFCTNGVEEFQRKHFPGRTEVTLNDLLPHMDNGYVEKLVQHQLAVASRSAGSARVGTCRERMVMQVALSMRIDDKFDQRRKNLRPLAQALGVNDRRWL